MLGMTMIASLMLLAGGATLAQDDDEPLNFDTEGDEVAFANGVTQSSSPDVFTRFINANSQIRVIVFEYMSGSDDDEQNLVLGRRIHARKLHHHLNSDSDIVSGSVDLFLSGAVRTADCGAKVGVHSWADGDGVEGKDLPRNHPDHQVFLSYYRDIGISADFYWYTLGAAPANGMHYMSPSEMEKWGVVTKPMNCQ